LPSPEVNAAPRQPCSPGDSARRDKRKECQYSGLTRLPISVTPDDRWPGGAFDHLSTISITNFEVIQTTGPTEGPRSPNPTVANAGPDQTIGPGTSANLPGFVSFKPTNPPPTVAWQFYSGPGTVTFGDATRTNTTATFGAPGVYTLLLSADDGVHAVAYDAVVVSVIPSVTLRIARAGQNVQIDWSGGNPPFTLESTDAFPTAQWSTVLTTNSYGVRVPITGSAVFYRVVGRYPSAGRSGCSPRRGVRWFKVCESPGAFFINCVASY